MLAAVAAPVAAVSLLFVLVAGTAGATPPPARLRTRGTASTIGNVTLDAEQMGNAQVIVTVTASRSLPAYASVVTVAASYTEAKLRNDQIPHDYNSIGTLPFRAGCPAVCRRAVR